MKLKEFSLTDIIAVISAAALIVTMASQTYFYYKLDALWVMSILSPFVYFIEVMKVLLLTSILIVGVSIFETIYSFLLKIFVHDKFHRALVLSGFFFLKIASTFLNSSFFPKPIKRRIAI